MTATVVTTTVEESSSNLFTKKNSSSHDYEEIIPNTMKAIIIKELRTNIDDVLIKTNERVVPSKPKADQLLIRVMYCALAPGDVRVQSGQVDMFQKPKEFPYIPGGDVTGIVVAVGSNSDGKDDDDDDKTENKKEEDEVNERVAKFHIGDKVAAMFTLPGPTGGLAEYVIVQAANAYVLSSSTSNMMMAEASCLPSSGLTALSAMEQHVTKDSRILVLGGSGGVGTIFIQLCKQVAQASYVATTSTQSNVLHSLGADRVIDYRYENWWEIPEFQQQPFDIIFDLVGGNNHWDHIVKTSYSNCCVLKSSGDDGIFLAAAGDNAHPEIHNVFDLSVLMVQLMGRIFYSKYLSFGRLPQYQWHEGLEVSYDKWERLYTYFETGKIKAIIDRLFEFDNNNNNGNDKDNKAAAEQEIKQAFHMQASRHVHGKVVVHISD